MIEKVQKGMRAFVECQVVEDRIGVLKSLITETNALVVLAKLGYLQKRETEDQIWFSLTEKGQAYLKESE